MITLEKEINISRLYEEKGDLYCRLGEYNEAIKDYKEAIKFGDKLDIVDFGGEFYSTTGSYDDVDCASEWGVNGEMPYIKIGDAYCELKEYDNAIAYYEEVTSLYDYLLDPESCADEDSYFINQFSHRDTFVMKDEYYVKNGDAYYQLGEYQEAIDNYTKAIALNENNHEYYDKREAANYRLGRYEEAKKDHEQSLLILGI